MEGVREEVIQQCNDVIEIPQYGMKHSLNIAVSMGLVTWDILNKMQPK